MFDVKRKIVAIILTMVALAAAWLSGCTSTNTEPAGEDTPFVPGEGFAIYLTKEDIPPLRMEMLSHVEIADEPVIGIDGIISYDAGTHEILLTSEACTRIGEMKVPTSGTSFLVCIDKSPVYWGAFWAIYSSQSFDGITIWMPFSTEGLFIQIKPGYPDPGFYSGKDPRNNANIMQSLKDTGKLVNELPTSFIDELPKSFKSWELYSWQEEGKWQFRLITGTNRNKTPEEILADASTLDGLMSIRVAGVERLLSVMAKLPEGEEVIWLDGHILTAKPASGTEIILAEENIVARVKHYAESRGLKLTAIR